MLSLHLKKSRMILDRTGFVRRHLLGQALHPQRTPISVSLAKRRDLYKSVHKLSRKKPLKHIANHKIIVPKPVGKTAQQSRLAELSAQIEKEKTRKKSLKAPKAAKTVQVVHPQTRFKAKGRSLRSTAFTFFMSLSFALLVTLFGPLIYFRFLGHEVVPVQTTETGTVLGGEFRPSASPAIVEQPKIQEPPFNENLPEGNWLIIPRIGVNTEILESQIAEESLLKGVWRVPEFGLPGDQDLPMILAAHRYGYNWWWKGEYWKYNSFYLLPELQPGDVVEVISNKRKYLYEIYSGEEGTEITDYNANLILYTCKYLTSDIRHFRYARLIDPTKYPTSKPTPQVKTETVPSAAGE